MVLRLWVVKMSSFLGRGRPAEDAKVVVEEEEDAAFLLEEEAMREESWEEKASEDDKEICLPVAAGLLVLGMP